MHKARVKFFVVISLLLFCLLIGCVPTAPNQGNNSAGDEQVSTDRVVMVELFVAPTCSRCPAAKLCMESLTNKYGLDQMVVLEEYGWDDPSGLYTGWYIQEAFNRFKWYSDNVHTPDAYFNGLNQNVRYNEFSFFAYQSAIEAELKCPPKVSISASYSVSDLIVSINGEIENITSETLENLVTGAMVYENSVELGMDTANHVVRDIITSDQIDTLSAGENFIFSFESEILTNVKDMENIHVVVYAQAPFSDNKEILQALYVEK